MSAEEKAFEDSLASWYAQCAGVHGKLCRGARPPLGDGGHTSAPINAVSGKGYETKILVIRSQICETKIFH